MKTAEDRFRIALEEWICKTQWVQESSVPKELGKHRADIIMERIDSLKAENEALRKDAERYRFLRQYTVDSYLAQGSFETLDRGIDSVMSKENPNG